MRSSTSRARSRGSASSSLRGGRAGLTLVELLISISIISLVAVALGTLARATQISAAYVEGHAAAAQHARVVAERMQRAVQTCSANEAFPGAILLIETVGGVRFPDTLVVWKPAAGVAVVDPTGLPRFSELVIYCPNPSAPQELLEITSRADTRTVPPVANASAWATELAALKQGNTSKRVVLTDLLRTASVTNSNARRGCVRFEVVLRPSAVEISRFRNGTTPWSDLSWPQHWYGEATGMRQTWVRWELQLLPNSRAAGTAADSLAIPFPGSAARYYDLLK